MEDPNPNPPRHAQEFPATLPLKPVHMRNLETKTKLGTPPVRPGGPEVSKMCPDREMLAHRFHADLRVYAAAANSLRRGRRPDGLAVWSILRPRRYDTRRAAEMLEAARKDARGVFVTAAAENPARETPATRSLVQDTVRTSASY